MTGRRPMMQWMVLWFAAAILFLAIDMAWLLWLGRSLYVSEIGEILRQPPNLWAAAAFYLLYVTGMLVMVIWPAVQAQSALQGLLYGALLGLIAYGTYDLTNLAVMKGFTARIAIIDMIWGTALTASVSALAVLIGTKLLSR
ncbi:DUF2177 family protein [Aestuariivirga sp.]|uniref:DUF2177 family protein n=1 Tax=Aestuariivirga sp. TaxID=2650926 RepID=UPI00391A87FF